MLKVYFLHFFATAYDNLNNFDQVQTKLPSYYARAV